MITTAFYRSKAKYLKRLTGVKLSLMMVCFPQGIWPLFRQNVCPSIPCACSFIKKFLFDLAKRLRFSNISLQAESKIPIKSEAKLKYDVV